MKVALCKVEEIPDEGTRTVDFLGREVLVFKVNEKPKAVLNTCLHLGGPMQLAECKLVCQWHQAEYDIKDGKRLKGPARPDARLITLPTRIEDEVLNYVYGE